MNIYVGNLPYETGDEELREAFEAFGEVTSATVIKDKVTGRSRGFGFVEMTSNEEAQAAIANLNGADMGGRSITVNEARPKSEGGRGGRGGGRSGGRGGRGGGRGDGPREGRRDDRPRYGDRDD